MRRRPARRGGRGDPRSRGNGRRGVLLLSFGRGRRTSKFFFTFPWHLLQRLRLSRQPRRYQAILVDLCRDQRRETRGYSRARQLTIAKAFAWALSFRKRNNFDRSIRFSSAAASAAGSFRDDDSNNTIHPVDIY